MKTNTTLIDWQLLVIIILKCLSLYVQLHNVPGKTVDLFILRYFHPSLLNILISRITSLSVTTITINKIVANVLWHYLYYIDIAELEH